MPIFVIIWTIIALLIGNKFGATVGWIVFYFPVVLVFMLCLYAWDPSAAIGDVLGINIIGIGASILWCFLLRAIASQKIFIWLGVVPTIASIVLFQIIPSFF